MYGYEEGYDETAALQEFEQAIALDPDYIQAHLRRGSILSSLGDWEAAIAAFDQAIVRNPWAFDAYADRHATRLVFERFQSYGDLDAEIAVLDEASAKNASDAEAYTGRGRLHFLRALFWDQEEGLDRAIADLDRAIELDPSSATAFHLRGLARHTQAYDNLFEIDIEIDPAVVAQAIVDYDMAIRLDPTLADAYADRATARMHILMYDESGDMSADAVQEGYDQALADYSAAVDLEPGKETYLLMRAYARYARYQGAMGPVQMESDADVLTANWQGVIDDATGIIQMNPESVAAYLLRAIACTNGADASADPDTIDRWQECAEQDEEALEELDPYPSLDFAGVLFWLGTIPVLSLGPDPMNDLLHEGNESLAGLGVDDPAPAGAIDRGRYTSADGSFRIGVPEPVEPSPFVWDEIAANGDRVVALEGAETGESYILQVHAGVLGDQTLETWVDATVAPWFKTQGVETLDTANGPAVVLEYIKPSITVQVVPGPAKEIEYAQAGEACALAILPMGKAFYSANYCSGLLPRDTQPVELAVQFLDSLELAPE